MKQKYIRPVILLYALLCSVAILLFPKDNNYIPLLFVPVFVIFGGKAFWEGQELYSYLERHFPEYYKKHKIINGTVGYVWNLTDKEILNRLDATVLQMVKTAKFYIGTIAIAFVLFTLLAIGTVITKW